MTERNRRQPVMVMAKLKAVTWTLSMMLTAQLRDHRQAVMVTPTYEREVPALGRQILARIASAMP
jgi:hypothetical protein